MEGEGSWCACPFREGGALHHRAPCIIACGPGFTVPQGIGLGNSGDRAGHHWRWRSPGSFGPIHPSQTFASLH